MSTLFNDFYFIRILERTTRLDEKKMVNLFAIVIFAVAATEGAEADSVGQAEGGVASTHKNSCPTGSLKQVVVHCLSQPELANVNACLEDASRDDCACFSAPEFKSCAAGCWQHLETAVCPNGPPSPARVAEQASGTGGEGAGAAKGEKETDGSGDGAEEHSRTTPSQDVAQTAPKKSTPKYPGCTSDDTGNLIKECFKSGTAIYPHSVCYNIANNLKKTGFFFFFYHLLSIIHY